MTENEYVNKQTILDAIIAAEPKEENYQLVSSKGYVCETVFVKAHSLWQNIVDIIEATQPTECKPVVHGNWKKYTHYNVVGISEGYQCSVCGEGIGYNEYGGYKFSCFCHECGAIMDESEV